MRYTKLLRKRAEDVTQPLIARDFCLKLATYVDKLEEELRDLLSDDPEWNRRIHNLLQDGEMDAGKRDYKHEGNRGTEPAPGAGDGTDGAIPERREEGQPERSGAPDADSGDDRLPATD